MLANGTFHEEINVISVEILKKNINLILMGINSNEIRHHQSKMSSMFVNQSFGRQVFIMKCHCWPKIAAMEAHNVWNMKNVFAIYQNFIIQYKNWKITNNPSIKQP